MVFGRYTEADEMHRLTVVVLAILAAGFAVASSGCGLILGTLDEEKTVREVTQTTTTLRIQSVPDEVEVQIDSQPVGYTPLYYPVTVEEIHEWQEVGMAGVTVGTAIDGVATTTNMVVGLATGAGKGTEVGLGFLLGACVTGVFGIVDAIVLLSRSHANEESRAHPTITYSPEEIGVSVGGFPHGVEHFKIPAAEAVRKPEYPLDVTLKPLQEP